MTHSQSSLLTLVIAASAVALLFAVFLARWVLARSRGTPEMQKISNAIQQGAEAYLARQYKTIALLSVVVAVLLGVGYGFFRPVTAHDPVQNPRTFALYVTASFLLGALSSGVAGYIGMWVSIRSNIRVAAAAMTSLNDALQTALRGGAVSGLFTVAMSLLGVGGLFAALSTFAPAGVSADEWAQRIPFLIVGYGFGASLRRALRAAGRRHLYQGGGRRRGSRRQGRGGHPRGRSAQSGGHRGSRGRQRR